MRALFLMSALLVGIITSCSTEDIPETRHVRYEIECADCMVVYVDEDSTQVTEYDQNSSWFYEFDAKPGVLLLLAYNTDDQPRGVTARIIVDGEISKEATRFCPVAGYALVTDTIE